MAVIEEESDIVAADVETLVSCLDLRMYADGEYVRVGMQTLPAVLVLESCTFVGHDDIGVGRDIGLRENAEGSNVTTDSSAALDGYQTLDMIEGAFSVK